MRIWRSVWPYQVLYLFFALIFSTWAYQPSLQCFVLKVHTLLLKVLQNGFSFLICNFRKVCCGFTLLGMHISHYFQIIVRYYWRFEKISDRVVWVYDLSHSKLHFEYVERILLNNKQGAVFHSSIKCITHNHYSSNFSFWMAINHIIKNVNHRWTILFLMDKLFFHQ